MTDKQLRRLSRSELLEMLLSETKENEELRAEIAQLKWKLESREIAVSNAGSIAEASLKLNGVFESAQAAADQYLVNIVSMDKICKDMRRDAEKEAERIIAEAKEESRQYWNELSGKLERFYQEHKEIKEMLSIGEKKINGE